MIFSWSQCRFCARKSRQYISPPLGPRFSSFWTSSNWISVDISKAQLYFILSLAGSKLIMAYFRFMEVKNWSNPSHKVDFPEPLGPITNTPKIWI